MNSEYDAQSEFNYAYECRSGDIPFDLKDSVVLAYIQGEHDNSDYHWFVQTPRGTYVYVWGGCDYTGWDCQAGIAASEEYNKASDINFDLLFPSTDNSNNNVREEMTKQLKNVLFSAKFESTINQE